jgi:hypothetical protein
VTPEAKAGEVGGIRFLAAAFPAPEGWDKNDRIGTILHDPEKRGRKFMSPPAREYREMVVNTVMDVLIAAGADRKLGFFRRPWGGVMLQFSDQTYDSDHWASGVQDDLCKAGVAKTDEHCFGIWPLKLAPVPGGGIYLLLCEGRPQ